MTETLEKQKPGKENALPMKYNKSYYVIQANELVRSRQDELTLLEAKLIRLAIAQVLKEDADLKTYTCNTAKLADFLGISRQAVYNDVQALSLGLMKKSIFIKDKDGKPGKQNYKIFHWADYIEYKDGDITIKLSEHLKPYLLGLNELFTRYDYEQILGLPTSYSIRLFELLYSYSSMQYQTDAHAFTFEGEKLEKDEIVFTVAFLREYFNCQDKYPNTGDFVKRIIKAGIKDINEHTVFPCQYRLIKEKSKIVKIVFKIGYWPESEESERLREEARARYEAISSGI